MCLLGMDSDNVVILWNKNPEDRKMNCTRLEYLKNIYVVYCKSL